MLADPFASRARPALVGVSGAVAAAHPLAVSAGIEILAAGGSAVDAAIAAQAVLCVIAPDACGLGGDLFALVRAPGEGVLAVNGAGAAPGRPCLVSGDGGASVTVPGLVDAWDQMAERWGRLPLARALDPARRIARAGFRVPPRLARAVASQRARLERGGAGRWDVVRAKPGARVVQNELALLLDRIGKERAHAFYRGEIAAAIEAAVAAAGGALAASDLAAHRTVVRRPVTIDWRGLRVHAQPPMAQGVLLAIALRALERLGPLAGAEAEHAAIEATLSAFALRDRVGEGEALLDEPVAVDRARASRRGGPRAYLHTAGVATADARGLVVSSLVSVFDDFGSGVFVPAGGFVLNNRAGGFTAAPNEAAPGKRPVHTLAPALAETPRGPLALATPGADGQVQTLLQVLGGVFAEGLDLACAIDRPRWRSEAGKLLVGAGHPWRAALAAKGHDLVELPDGDMRFGAVVAAGLLDESPVAAADWRRETWAGAA